MNIPQQQKPAHIQILEDKVDQLLTRVRILEEMLGIRSNTIHLKIGSSEIIMNPQTMTLKAHDIKIQASDDVSIKAASDIVMKGSKIRQN